MLSRTKLGIYVLIGLAFLVGASSFIKSITGWQGFKFDYSFVFEFESSSLMKVVQKSLSGREGTFAVYVESLFDEEKYTLNEFEAFPAASLYKLILLAAVLKEIEGGRISAEGTVTSTKSYLIQVLGEEDFGYASAPEQIEYTVEAAMNRVAEISDNFAAIMLTEKLRQIRTASGEDEKLLIRMAADLGMTGTSFDPPVGGPVVTNASDIAAYFRALYKGEVVSKTASDKIIDALSKSKINDRIPALLPEGVKVVHKTGELSRVRHDAGLIYPPNLPNHPYLLVLLSKDLQFEDDGIENLAQLSKDIYDYFQTKTAKK